MKPAPQPFSDSFESSHELSSQASAQTPLAEKGTYTCPVCRHGHIQQLTLMDAFACDFCRHIFEVNYSQQTVRVVDSSQPMMWFWNGRHWRSGRVLDKNLTLFLWIISAALVLLPVSMIGISLYIFPPLSGSRWAWIPLFWTICTFLAHFIMVSWLLAEHYQPALYITTKLKMQRWVGGLTAAS